MKRLLNLFILVSFVANLALPYNANAQTLNLPVPTQILNVSQNYSFPVLRGLKLDPKNPLNIEFIIDPGTQKSVNKEEAGLLIKYFLAALTIPRENLWVNLSPYESNRIVPQALSQTELGEDMLGQDYLLKQLAASMTYPETEVGKKYWDEMNGVGARSPRPGRGNPAPTSVFNKVWITADKAQIYEGKNVALITKSSLKALTEEDYLAVQNNVGARSPRPEQPSKDALGGQGNPAPTEPFKRYILPSINKEINQGKNFAQLRQIYNAVILGLWFKNKFQESFYKNYFNKETVKGIDTADKAAKDKIYNLYVEAFKKGVYNYVKREYAGTGTGSPIRGSVYAPGRIIKRQYFSGGVTPAQGLPSTGGEITTTLGSVGPGAVTIVAAMLLAGTLAVATSSDAMARGRHHHKAHRATTHSAHVEKKGPKPVHLVLDKPYNPKGKESTRTPEVKKNDATGDPAAVDVPRAGGGDLIDRKDAALLGAAGALTFLLAAKKMRKGKKGPEDGYAELVQRLEDVETRLAAARAKLQGMLSENTKREETDGQVASLQEEKDDLDHLKWFSSYWKKYSKWSSEPLTYPQLMAILTAHKKSAGYREVADLPGKIDVHAATIKLVTAADGRQLVTAGNPAENAATFMRIKNANVDLSDEKIEWILHEGGAGKRIISNKAGADKVGGVALGNTAVAKAGSSQNFYFENIPDIKEITSMGFVIDSITPNQTISQILN